MSRTPQQCGHDTGEIEWPVDTAAHLIEPICPTCPDCQAPIPTGTQHNCPKSSA